jgi:hypothetical protein
MYANNSFAVLKFTGSRRKGWKKMDQVIIKHRLFTWFEEVEDNLAPGRRQPPRAHRARARRSTSRKTRSTASRASTRYDPPFYTDEQAR